MNQPVALAATDAEDIAELLDQVAMHDGQAVAGGWSANSLADQLTAKHSQAWGHRTPETGRLQSMVLIQSIADMAEILVIAVAPTDRREGLAKELIRHAIGAVGQSGGKQLDLEVAANNKAAIGLYTTLGFIETGRRPRYYGDVDAVLMQRRIAETDIA
ncbi:MAG: GNAT family N-acetyltransferase [Pseudomonadota bacterium]